MWCVPYNRKDGMLILRWYMDCRYSCCPADIPKITVYNGRSCVNLRTGFMPKKRTCPGGLARRSTYGFYTYYITQPHRQFAILLLEL